MRRYDMYESSSRLIVARSRASVLSQNRGLVLISLLLAAPWIVWVLVLIHDGSARSQLHILLPVLAAAAATLYALVRGSWWGPSHLGEPLILDRARDAVTRGDQRLCAFSELASVQLRRCLGDEAPPSYEVGLVVPGLRPPAAPLAAPSIFDDTIALDEWLDEGEMRAYAARIAAFAGVPVEERGW